MAKDRAHAIESKEAFEGGATRSEKLERFDLVPPEADILTARRFGLGAKKHGAGNWKNGGVEFIKATINHLKAHTASLLINDPVTYEDDDLGGILWGGAALAWFRERKPTQYRQALWELREGNKNVS